MTDYNGTQYNFNNNNEEEALYSELSAIQGEVDGKQYIIAIIESKLKEKGYMHVKEAKRRVAVLKREIREIKNYLSEYNQSVIG